MAERVSSEELAKWLAVHREREEGRDCDCWDCEKSRDLLDARAEIVVATKELTRLSVEIVRAERERDEASPVLKAARELRCAALRIPKHMTGGEWSDVVLPMSLAGDIVEAIRVYDLAHAAAKDQER